MCGIVGAIARRHVEKILIEGLRRLEYRGYDSAGIALIDHNKLKVRKAAGKVSNLDALVQQQADNGYVGIAHTRWATHGKPTRINAHPHVSGKIAVVHNGIIENHEILRQKLIDDGYTFLSDTDTEVVAHLIHHYVSRGMPLLDAVKAGTDECEGAYALAVINADEPSRIVATREGSPLVIGISIEENFVASDVLALRQVTDRFIYLQEGDTAEICANSISIFDREMRPVERPSVQLNDGDQSVNRGNYRHFMLKEIYEQPAVIAQTLEGRLGKTQVLENCFGINAKQIFDQTRHIHIVACGTSFHAGLVAKYWMESWAEVACSVEVASEYRYRSVVVPKDCLLVIISQSGETADTLAALRKAKRFGYLTTLAICNVANSSLVRESNLSLMTEAGTEVGVASTKAFTTQLVALQLLTIVLGRRNGLSSDAELQMVKKLHELPKLCEQALELDKKIEHLSKQFVDKQHALFLGRGIQYPIAMEGALKLKEISYIHAEAYPAGELKHGPLALVDKNMPVIAVAANDELIDKLKSNLHEVHARGGELIVFADTDTQFEASPGFQVINLPRVPFGLTAIVFTIPLQLLAYHVAILKGTDVDRPRNLAKSVTVE
ncbi:MAG: glucosamine--fructose-6-phosphate aminotransferase (isomerizing) [Cellvibrionaceae bacterium]|jgi:glucosamine--fructose-6-phosphate aminotransferase (isomerizing)